MRAINGGNLALTSIGLTQSGAGTLSTAGASTLTLSGSSIVGGTISTPAPGSTVVTGQTDWNALTFNGVANVNSGITLRTSGSGFINNGRLTINGTAGGSISQLQLLASTTISGTGTVLLNAPQDNIDAARFIYNGGGELLTNDTGHTIAGRGRVYTHTLNKGILSPGSAPGIIDQLQFNQTLNLEPTSLVDIEIGGDTEFDTIVSSSTLSVDGMLRVTLVNAYVPGYGTTFDILRGPGRNGTFSTVEAPGFVVTYLSDRVRLTAVCDADYNLDGNVDQGDVDAMIDDLASGNDSFPPNVRDFNRDGNADQGDLDLLINVIAGGGCQP